MKYNVSLMGYENVIKDFATDQEAVDFGFAFMDEHLDMAEWNAEKYQSDIVVNIDKLNDDESMMEENWKWLHGYKSGTSDEWKFEQA